MQNDKGIHIFSGACKLLQLNLSTPSWYIHADVKRNNHMDFNTVYKILLTNKGLSDESEDDVADEDSTIDDKMVKLKKEILVKKENERRKRERERAYAKSNEEFKRQHHYHLALLKLTQTKK